MEKTDLTYLSSICDGNNSIILEMIELFSIQILEIATEMQHAEKECNYEALSNVAHKAKSTVAIMGMNTLAEKLRELEIMAKEKTNIDSYNNYIEFFIQETTVGIKELIAYRETLIKS